MTHTCPTANCKATVADDRAPGRDEGDTIADSDRLDQHMYGWPMLDPVEFPAPIPAAGAQGFWNWS